MNKVIFIFIFFFLFQNNLSASNKAKIINKFDNTKNLSFNFIQTINDKNEKGKCTIQYPKKIYCEYEKKNKKILVSNGKSLVIKNSKQYYRYPLKSTPFALLLDKKFLINKMNSSNLNETESNYFFFQISENNNNINIFFSKKNFELIGWQVEDVYQNLAVTYIFDTVINAQIDEKLFKLPKQN